MTASGLVRRLPVAAAAVLGTGTVLALGAALSPASAVVSSQRVSVTAQDHATSPYTTDTVLTLTGQVNHCAGPVCDQTPVTLTLTDPVGCSFGVAAGTADTLSYALNLASVSWPAGDPCTGEGEAARNGTWTLALNGDGASAKTTFAVRTPPAPPQSVRAAYLGGTKVEVSWAPNTEPDLASYALLDAGHHDAVLLAGISPTSANCSSGTCAVGFTFPAGTSGSRTLAVSAQRTTGVRNVQASSAPSKPATVDFSTPSPSASPSGHSAAGHPAASPSPTGSRSTHPAAASNSAHPAASPTGSQALVNKQQAVDLTFSTFAPITGIAPVPTQAPAPDPQVAAPPPAPGTVEPTAQGTYSPTLKYPDKVVVQKTLTRTHASGVLTSVAGVSGAHLWRSLAAALLLCLLAVHARVWLGRGEH